jgi:acetolactate synthase-1/3 small subunit
MRRAVFSILADNNAGVLSRVTGLFSRRGYSIDSLTAGRTNLEGLSRMTITVSGEDDVLEQIEKQLSKLEDVREIKELPAEASVCRELILIKVKCDVSQRQNLAATTGIFREQIVDVSKNSVIISLTGDQSKLNAFIELLELDGYEIIELTRTGITGLARGSVQ